MTGVAMAVQALEDRVRALEAENTRLRAALTEALNLMAQVPCTSLRGGEPSKPCAWCLAQKRIRDSIHGNVCLSCERPLRPVPGQPELSVCECDAAGATPAWAGIDGEGGKWQCHCGAYNTGRDLGAKCATCGEDGEGGK